MRHFRRYRNVTLKILLALGAFYVVFAQTDVPLILRYMKGVNPTALVGSFVILILAQLVSAYRMRYYYVSAGQPMSRWFSVALYFVGMLYNAVLPGGIGGDGYKVYLMGKLAKFSHLTSVRLMFSNRASGLYLLLIYTVILALFSQPLIERLPYAYILLMTSAVIISVGYFIAAKILLKEPLHIALNATKYSALVQGACVLTGYILFLGMNNLHGQMSDYLMVFLISSIVSVIPISIGGAGLREVTFLYASKYLGLDVELGIAFSIVYFAINLLCSLCGLFFVTKLTTIWEASSENVIIQKEPSHGRNENTNPRHRMESPSV